MKRRRRYYVMVADPLLDEDFAHASFATRAEAKAEAARLNWRYVRWSFGARAWGIPLAYVVAVMARVRVKRAKAGRRATA
jgi:hypothetical protein